MHPADTNTAEDPLTLPAAPAEPPYTPFPLVASIAPLAICAVLWAVTRSPFTLIFAGLSPLIAIAGFLDRKIGSRRRRRKDVRAHDSALVALQVDVEARQDAEREALRRRTPSAHSIAAAGTADVERWRALQIGKTFVSIGTGVVRSTLRISGKAGSDAERDLVSAAAALPDAPVRIEADDGIGVVGPSVLADALLRGLVLQLARRLSPRDVRIAAAARPGWEWLDDLPHTSKVEQEAARTTVRIVDTRGEGKGDAARRRDEDGFVLALAAALEFVPTECRTIVAVDSVSEARIVTRDDRSPGETARPELVTAEEARRYAADLTGHARSSGLRTTSALPANIGFDRLDALEAAGEGLACPIGMSVGGVVDVDLVSDGPHAIVGGTTGSGKSELLITWIVSMAAGHSPQAVTFLLVDFKGGATFHSLEPLPHCVGVITDLDPAAAERALESLRAEMAYRERLLTEHGARDIGDDCAPDSLARLVIVVDEFAAMVERFSQLHAVFVDIASRGRSLGVHLILCTQQPAAVARDALLANCNLRLSLRVNNRADSQAVIGSDEASTLPAALPGRCLLEARGRRSGLIQVAVTAADDIEAVARDWRDEATPRRPWLEPLPVRLGRHRPPPEHGFLLGLVDDPVTQTQPEAAYRPDADGHLLVVGALGTGKSTLLSSLEDQSRPEAEVRRLPVDVEGAWDTLMSAVETLGSTSSTTLLAIDDLDSLVARFGPDHVDAALDALTLLLRDGPASGVYVIATARRTAGAVHSLTSLFSRTLLLGMPTRQDHILAGGDPAGFLPDPPPGRGSWRGKSIQLFETDELPRPVSPPPPVVDLIGEPLLAMVSRRPAALMESLRARVHPARRVVAVAEAFAPRAQDVRPFDATESIESDGCDRDAIIVGDPDSWQAQWTALSALRSRATFVFDACSQADVRGVTGVRRLPPPVVGPNRVWVFRPDGSVERCRLE